MQMIPLESQSFYNNNLNLLVDAAPETRNVSVQHKLNKSQTRALGGLNGGEQSPPRAPLPPWPGVRIDAAMVSEIEAASMAFSDRSVPLLLLHWVLLLVERFCSFQPEPDSKEKSKETGRSLLLCMPKP